MNSLNYRKKLHFSSLSLSLALFAETGTKKCICRNHMFARRYSFEPLLPAVKQTTGNEKIALHFAYGQRQLQHCIEDITS
jgi:hypothetical protein